MDKDEVNSTFDFDNDPELMKIFIRIEMAFGETNVETPSNTIEDNRITEEEQAVTATSSEVTEAVAENMEEPAATIENPIGAEVHSNPIDFSDRNVSFRSLSEDDIEEELIGINEALARQICEEMDHASTTENKRIRRSNAL